jgi:hypothetical protein
MTGVRNGLGVPCQDTRSASRARVHATKSRFSWPFRSS